MTLFSGEVQTETFPPDAVYDDDSAAPSDFDVVPPIDVPDPVDVDPLFSPVTGKTYNTSRGRKIAESRWTKKHSDSDTSSSPRPRGSSKSLKPRLTGFYETVGTLVGMVGFQADGQLIVDNAAPCAEAMSEWADSDPRVRAVLDRLLTSGAVSKVFLTHAMLGMGIASNHGVNPLAFLAGRQSA